MLKLWELGASASDGLYRDEGCRVTVISDRSGEAYFVKIRIPRITCLTGV